MTHVVIVHYSNAHHLGISITDIRLSPCFLSANSYSSVLLVVLSKEGVRKDYFQILEKNGRIEPALGVIAH